MDELSEATKKWITTPEGDAFARALSSASAKALTKCYSEAMGDKFAQTGQFLPLSEDELLGVLGRTRSETIQELKEQGWDLSNRG